MLVFCPLEDRVSRLHHEDDLIQEVFDDDFREDDRLSVGSQIMSQSLAAPSASTPGVSQVVSMPSKLGMPYQTGRELRNPMSP